MGHLEKYKKELDEFERKITIFHCEIVKKLEVRQQYHNRFSWSNYLSQS